MGGLPPFVGTLMGTFASGPFSDWFVKVCAKRNKGVFEPEFRLILLAPFALFVAIGSFGWAYSTDPSWPVIAVVRELS